MSLRVNNEKFNGAVRNKAGFDTDDEEESYVGEKKNNIRFWENAQKHWLCVIAKTFEIMEHKKVAIV